MTTEPVAERQQRTCSVCDQTDDHPHHIHYQALSYQENGAVRGVDISHSRHLDCCRSTGCRHCEIVLTHAGDKRGVDLANFIQSKPAELHADLRAAGFDVED